MSTYYYTPFQYTDDNERVTWNLLLGMGAKFANCVNGTGVKPKERDTGSAKSMQDLNVVKVKGTSEAEQVLAGAKGSKEQEQFVMGRMGSRGVGGFTTGTKEMEQHMGTSFESGKLKMAGMERGSEGGYTWRKYLTPKELADVLVADGLPNKKFNIKLICCYSAGPLEAEWQQTMELNKWWKAKNGAASEHCGKCLAESLARCLGGLGSPGTELEFAL